MSSNLISSDDARKDLLSCAAYVAENIRSAEGHAEAIRAILPFYLEKKDVDLAAEFANGVDDPFTRDRLLTQVAEKCAAIDDDDYAFQLLEAIEDYGAQSQARERIAIVKSGKSDFEKAFEIAESLDHPDNVCAVIAVDAAADGDVETTTKALEMIGFPYSKVVALQTIAMQLIEKKETKAAVENLERSLEEAEEIDFTEEKLRALVDAGSHFIDAGRRDRAIETFDGAKQLALTLDNVHRDSFLAAAAYGLFRAGSVDLADATLDLVADKTQIASTLVGFARHHHDNKENEEALAALEEAYAVLKSQHEKETRDSRAKFALFGTIAGLAAELGKAERAIEIAVGIPDENEQMTALGRVAKNAAAKGDEDLSRAAVEAITDDSKRVGALVAIADARKELDGDEQTPDALNEAAALIDSIPQLAARAGVGGEIAVRFAKSGHPERAREVLLESLENVAKIRDESSQAVTLAEFSRIYDGNDLELTEAELKILEAIVRKIDA